MAWVEDAKISAGCNRHFMFYQESPVLGKSHGFLQYSAGGSQYLVIDDGAVAPECLYPSISV